MNNNKPYHRFIKNIKSVNKNIVMNKIIYGIILLCFISASISANVKMEATKHIEKIVLGAGCFWGVEKEYASIPGVIDAVSGYADGMGVAPNYKAITDPENKNNPNNHAEVVEVTFNKNEVSATDLIQHFFESHDPTQLNRQGNDVGTQYRSIILTTNENQQEKAKQALAEYQLLLSEGGYGAITTKIKSLTEFYPAEDYHQDYLVKNPNGYCPIHATGIKFNSKKEVMVDNSLLFEGKNIIVIEAEDFCPYCEKFKKDVSDIYQGSIPLTYKLANELDGLNIKTPTWATPTILFLENGNEVFSHQGYMGTDDFYQALGIFKLGKSDAYNVAFRQGTDPRFCKQYEIFKNTPDGIFVDKLSGAALFDTSDRFDSKSGWLSFTKPVDGAVYELEDNSYGMKRVEIRSTSSGIHLGHVFDDGPDGQPRYCINATVLEFKQRENL